MAKRVDPRIHNNFVDANFWDNSGDPCEDAAMIEILDLAQRVYNIGNNRSEKLMHFIGLIEDALGAKAEIEFAPMQDGDVKETYADIDAIQSAVGFNPATTIDEGVPRFVAWYRDYHGV